MRWFDIVPVPKPRMTQRDRWKKRPSVLRYHAFKDEIRDAGVTLPETPRLVFYLPMPPSWTRAKRERLVGGPHTQTPDLDNLVKAIQDACLERGDSGIWHVQATKLWGLTGRIGVGEAHL